MNIQQSPSAQTNAVIPFDQTARRLPSRLASPSPKLTVVGCFPPRRCGIATFTYDMVNAVLKARPDAQIEVYAMSDKTEEALAQSVKRVVIEDDLRSHIEAGIEIERGGSDVVWVQHEFGIFGGPSGAMVIDLLAPVSAPLIVTLHTVLDNPNTDQRRIMDWFVGHASRIVVMSEHSSRILQECYGAEPRQVEVIEHGVPDRPFGRSEAMKRRFGLEGRKVLLTFGLISPGKCIEVAISALPRIVMNFPQAMYVIAGATHPRSLDQDGEKYRDELKGLAEELGVADHIRWINEYLDIDDLLDLIEAAEIYLTPYSSPAQATSGTLAYAVALGKAVVSTPYQHAVELLAQDHGILTPFRDNAAMAAAICKLLGDPAALTALQHRAYRRGRSMTWANFGSRSIELVESVLVYPPPSRGAGHLKSTRALDRLCDGTGILQHSCFSVPDRNHGYCVDDNARALMLANQLSGDFANRAETFASFVQQSWNPDTRRFRNFMRYDRSWAEAEGSEDSCGRTLWAIGSTAADGATTDLRIWARSMWQQCAAISDEFNSPRAIAFTMLGAHRLATEVPGDALARRILDAGAQRLQDWLRNCSRDGWLWFEPVLSYDNCRLPEALLAAATIFDDREMTETALAALDWIAKVQTSSAGRFRPVGSESFGTNRCPPLPFDQQPVDAWATVDAAAAAWRRTRSERWVAVARAAHDWFSGENDRGIAVANEQFGACYDAVTPHGVNLNQGAESVLALHLASNAMANLVHEVEQFAELELRNQRPPAPA